MATLSIRKSNTQAYEQLRAQAATHGVPMEEEARQIIYQAVSAPEQISAVFKKYVGSDNGIDLGLDQRKPDQPLDPR